MIILHSLYDISVVLGTLYILAGFLQSRVPSLRTYATDTEKIVVFSMQFSGYERQVKGLNDAECLSPVYRCGLVSS